MSDHDPFGPDLGIIDSKEVKDKTMPAYIKELETLAQQHREALVKIKQLEAELSAVKSKRMELERVTIPDAMFELGIDSVDLSGGSTITVKIMHEASHAKLADGKTIDEDKTAAFYEWMQNNGFSGLVQSAFTVWTKDPEVVKFLKMACEVNSIGYEYVNKRIHPATLKSWFKEQSEKGTALPLELFSNWIGRVAVVK